jgi:hypothetical protein
MKIQPGVGHIFDSSSLGFSVDTSEQFPDADSNSSLCPLQIYNVRYDTTASQYLINVSPGHVNNYEVYDGASGTSAKLLSASPPPNIQIFTAGLTSPGATNYIYIEVENSGSPNYEYPSPSIPPKILVSTAAIIPDTDTISYILIGKIDGFKDTATPPNVTYGLYNFKGCGSLWTERFKCGSSDAVYFWSAV